MGDKYYYIFWDMDRKEYIAVESLDDIPHYVTEVKKVVLVNVLKKPTGWQVT